MEKIEFKTEKYVYIFINESYGTRNGFKHVTHLFRGEYCIAEHTCYYLNRTWESYRYQTVMIDCVYSLIDTELMKFVNRVKRMNNIKRLTETKKAELNEIFNRTEFFVDIDQLRRML